jgi:hypothetical protein
MQPPMNADERRYESSRGAAPAPDLIGAAQPYSSVFIPSYRRLPAFAKPASAGEGRSAFSFFSANLCVSVPLWFKATGAMPLIWIRNDG